jgi:hypothetical protein
MYNLKMKLDFLRHVMNISPYVINEDGSVDVRGRVYLDHIPLKTIPIKFGKVGGYFSCERKGITSLENFPDEVDGIIWFRHNNKRFTEEEIRAVCDVGGLVYV